MTEQTREQGREGEIDSFYGQPIGSRRLEIEKLHYKLQEKYFALCNKLHKKYEGSFRRINEGCKEIAEKDRLKWLSEQGYFELLHNSGIEHENLDESPLGRIVSNEPNEIFDTSDHENTLNSKDSLVDLDLGVIWVDDSDPVLRTVLDENVYKLNVVGNTRRERKKVRHRSDIYIRRMQKHVYEHYLSEAVGKPITVEEYEREFGFLSNKGE